ncbi:MAG TPA: SLBB domain-containing protein [Alphaproteobacteria bacterium]|nr:SLBB domain-containing protein [Alphaproteobacteria bacterium]
MPILRACLALLLLLLPMAAAAGPTPLEASYSARAGQPLGQIGYDLFAAGSAAAAPLQAGPPLGAVGDDYRLGIGDVLQVTLHSAVNHTQRALVDSEGLVMVERMRPLPAAGRSLGELREALQAQARAELGETVEVFVALSGVRRLGVLVVGAVARPGRHELTAFHTPLDALYAAGGIGRDGSLRRVELVRGGRGRVLDLYGLLQGGAAPATAERLRDGDRIVVHPLGPTVAVGGRVKRPGIYELAPGEAADVARLKALAGGPLNPGVRSHLRLRPGADGRDAAEPVAETALLADGDVLLLDSRQDGRSGTVTLAGAVRRPGPRPLAEAPTLGRLLGDRTALADDAYALFAVVRRGTPALVTRQILPVSPLAALAGGSDVTLADGDAVELLTLPEVERLLAADPASLPPAERDLAAALADHAVTVSGSVLRPGRYPLAGTAPLHAVLAAAGGPARDADLAAVELVDETAGRRLVDAGAKQAGALPVSAGAGLRVNPRFATVERQAVAIEGEVRRPGRYDLLRGETLSSLLARAGGLTEQAYPDGAVFTRESARRQEQAAFDRAARELDRAMLQRLAEKGDLPADQLAAARQLSGELRGAQALGRITVEADPDVLRAQPALDPLLEPGDRIVIPRRPFTVAVAGEVLSPSSLKFVSGKTAEDYLREAGGLTRHADGGRAFVVMPDGSARPLARSAWNFEPAFVPPGAMIVVPRDPEPFDLFGSVAGFTGLLGQLAVIAASGTVIAER